MESGEIHVRRIVARGRGKLEDRRDWTVIHIPEQVVVAFRRRGRELTETERHVRIFEHHERAKNERQPASPEHQSCGTEAGEDGEREADDHAHARGNAQPAKRQHVLI